jgi:hypothetical protein
LGLGQDGPNKQLRGDEDMANVTSSDPTKEQLYNQAKLNIEGRSKMTRTQLKSAVTNARS